MGAVTVGYVAAPAPLLAADTVDARTVQYLLKAALQKEEEEERKKAKEERRLEVTALLAVPIALRTPAQQRRIMTLSDEVDAEALSTQPGRRKRKKRKKKAPSPQRQVLWSRCAGNCGVPRLQFFDEVGMLVVVQRQVPWSAWQSSWTRLLPCPLLCALMSQTRRKLWVPRSQFFTKVYMLVGVHGHVVGSDSSENA